MFLTEPLQLGISFSTSCRMSFLSFSVTASVTVPSNPGAPTGPALQGHLLFPVLLLVPEGPVDQVVPAVHWCHSALCWSLGSRGPCCSITTVVSIQPTQAGGSWLPISSRQTRDTLDRDSGKACVCRPVSRQKVEMQFRAELHTQCSNFTRCSRCVACQPVLCMPVVVCTYIRTCV